MRKLLLAGAAIVVVAPFLYMISVSFMGATELLRWPPALLPAAPTTDNYAAAITALPYVRVLRNTAIFAGCVMVGQVLTSAAAGYAFARMKFPGRDGAFTLMVMLLTLPTFLLVIPRFLMIESLGWMDTFPGLIATELVSIWGILFMRQAFLMQPRDIGDAARLDGAGEWTLFWHVALPLARPAVAAVAILAFMDQWRNFLWPLIVTHSAKLEVAEVALAHFHSDYASNWPYQMAAAVLVTLPMLVVCVVASRYVTAGVRYTGADVRL